MSYVARATTFCVILSLVTLSYKLNCCATIVVTFMVVCCGTCLLTQSRLCVLYGERALGVYGNYHFRLTLGLLH